MAVPRSPAAGHRQAAGGHRSMPSQAALASQQPVPDQSSSLLRLRRLCGWLGSRSQLSRRSQDPGHLNIDLVAITRCEHTIELHPGFLIDAIDVSIQRLLANLENWPRLPMSRRDSPTEQIPPSSCVTRPSICQHGWVRFLHEPLKLALPIPMVCLKSKEPLPVSFARSSVLTDEGEISTHREANQATPSGNHNHGRQDPEIQSPPIPGTYPVHSVFTFRRQTTYSSVRFGFLPGR
jgi:hypothetical protein